jgi:hypothetical protein
LPGKGAQASTSKFTAIRDPSQPESYRGSVNLWPRACYDEENERPKPYSWTITVKWSQCPYSAIFNTYGQGCTLDGRVISNFIRQAMLGEDITIYGDGSQTRSFAIARSNEGLIRLMSPGRHFGPINLTPVI